MDNLGIKNCSDESDNQISKIIQGELIDLYGSKGYKSIIQTMTKISGKTEKDIISNYELFASLAEGVFGRMAESKILDPIKLELNKVGTEQISQKTIEEKSMRLLIADDEQAILDLYKSFLESKGYEVTATTDGRKCVEAYKRKNNSQQSENYFDVVILDHKMPIMTGLQAAAEILEINSNQKIIFASGYLERTLLEVLTKLNRAIAVIEKPFSLDVLNHMINNVAIFEGLEKININQEEKEINKKMSEIMTVLQN